MRHLETTRRPAAVALVIFAFVACKGGSSDGGGGGDEPTLTLQPSALTFTARQDAAPPTAQDVSISWSNAPDLAFIGAGFLGTEPSWAEVQAVPDDPPVMRVHIVSTSLTPGTHQARLVVGLLRADYSEIARREVPITYTVQPRLTATPSLLSFEHVLGSEGPAMSSLALAGSGIAWSGQADEPWVVMYTTAGTAPSTVLIGVDPTGLAPGDYEAHLTFTDGSGDPPASVTVLLTVRAPAFVVEPGALAFSGVNGTSLPGEDLVVSTNDASAIAWTATASESWVVLDPPAGEAPSTLTVRVDPAQTSLASGTHEAVVTLTGERAGAPLSTGIPIQLHLTAPALAVAPATVALGGANGRDHSPATVVLSLGTGASAYAWTATPSQPWITLDSSAGTVSEAGVQLAVGVDVEAAGPGTHEGAIEFSATVNGDTVSASLSVTAVVDAHRLVVSDPGAAFVSMPGLASLTRTLKIRDTFGLTTAWTATSDATWLTAEAGPNAGELVLSAEPEGLTADTLHEATVTVSADVPGVQGDVVRVGLWIGSSAPPANHGVAGAFLVLAVDPVRPYAYVHRGGPDVEVYNVFTGALVTTFTHVAPEMGGLAVSYDGSRLFVHDRTNHRVVPLALPSGTAGTPWTVDSWAESLVYARASGRGVVFTGSARPRDEETGAEYPMSAGGYVGGIAAVSRDGTRICHTSTGSSPHDVTCSPLQFSAAENVFLLGPARSGWAEGYDGDIAVNDDGTRVYHMRNVWDAASMGTAMQTLTAGGRAFEPLRDGRLLSAMRSSYDPTDLFIFDEDGFVLSSYRIAGYAKWVLDAQLGATGDGSFAVLVTDDPRLVFQRVAP